ncbi:MAG: uncharacterized protein FD156_1132 [Nitrospirae bacterium]|nr:MAG: uncharacterized protein FD156_1132 [Nitrospirota bacterium]
MVENFFLFNGLAACSRVDGATIIFSPYNLSVGILQQSNRIELSDYVQKCEKLGCFGHPSNQGPSLPDNFDLTLLITNDCNLRCKYCFAHGGEKRNYMTPEMGLSIVDKVFNTTDRKNIKVSFFGGEPTLNFNVIKEVVSSVRRLAPIAHKDYSFYITTNGVMSQEKLDYLVNNDFTFVISSDGIPKIHDFFRPGINGKPSSKNVEKTIRFLIEKNVPFKVRSTISKFNVDYMAENAGYFAEQGIKTLHFEPITHAGRGRSDDINLRRAGIDEYTANFKQALDIAKNKNVSIISSSYMNFLAPSQKFCDAMAGSRLVGSYNGDITLCVEVQDTCHPYSANAIVGHIDTHTSQIYFDNNKYKQVLRNVGTEQNMDCKQCFAKFSCGGGCPVKNYYSSGCERVDTYRCAITKGIVIDVLRRIYQESAVNYSDVIYESDSITLYRMHVPQEIWMKRKTSKISKILAEVIIDNEVIK